MSYRNQDFYRNITRGGTVTLIPKESGSDRGDNIRKILISNLDGHQADGVCVFLEDETESTSPHGDNVKFYFLRDVVIPVGAALVLDECVDFDARRFHLRIVTQNASDGGAPNLTVMIK